MKIDLQNLNCVNLFHKRILKLVLKLHTYIIYIYISAIIHIVFTWDAVELLIFRYNNHRKWKLYLLLSGHNWDIKKSKRISFGRNQEIPCII